MPGIVQTPDHTPQATLNTDEHIGLGVIHLIHRKRTPCLLPNPMSYYIFTILQYYIVCTTSTTYTTYIIKYKPHNNINLVVIFHSVHITEVISCLDCSSTECECQMLGTLNICCTNKEHQVQRGFVFDIPGFKKYKAWQMPCIEKNQITAECLIEFYY